MSRSLDIALLEDLSMERRITFYSQERICSCFFCQAGCFHCMPMNDIHRSSYQSLLFYVRNGLDIEPREAITSSHVKQAYDIEARLRSIDMKLTPDSLLNLCVKTTIRENINTRVLPKAVYSYCQYYQRYLYDFGHESLDLNILPLMLRIHLGMATDFLF